MSGGYLNIGTRELENFPIPAATKSQQQEIITLVDQILEAKKTDPSADTSSIESKIDQLVYKLYSLTDDEIKIVGGKFFLLRRNNIKRNPVLVYCLF